MRAASQLFYLAVFGLLGTSRAQPHASTSSSSKPSPSKSQSDPQTFCDVKPGAIVSDACASYSTLESLNEAIHPSLHQITQDTDFFSYYRLNLYNKACPFWSDENGMCGNKACAVNTLDNEEDIPLVWRAQELGRLEGPKAQHPGKRLRQERQERAMKPLMGELGEGVRESCVLEYDDECDERDYCVPDDEGATAKGDYVSLVDNPERFTGYAGVGANQVWEAIYRENCFSKPKDNGISAPPSSPFGALTGGQAQAAQNLRHLFKEQNVKQNVQSAIAAGTAKAPLDPVEFDDECLEKRVFYRVVSGMHASISSHLCSEWLNQTTGEWQPNLACYEHRLHKFPERISNIYFNYALLLRAVGKIRTHVKDYQFCTADPEQDQLTKKLVLDLTEKIPKGEEIFDESIMFQDPTVTDLKEDFRNRFRNVSRIMDCVGCDKCRLWGKLQTNGYGTALKVLFEFDENDSSKDPPLRQTELVALINTLDRLSHSLAAVKNFRHMIEERDGLAAEGLELVDEEAKQTPFSVPETPPKQPEKPKEPSPREEKEKDDGLPEASDDHHEPTIVEIFWEEWDLVWSTYAMVMKEQLKIPGRLFNIMMGELTRIWDYWLGLPVQPRTWNFKWNMHKDEL